MAPPTFTSEPLRDAGLDRVVDMLTVMLPAPANCSPGADAERHRHERAGLLGVDVELAGRCAASSRSTSARSVLSSRLTAAATPRPADLPAPNAPANEKMNESSVALIVMSPVESAWNVLLRIRASVVFAIRLTVTVPAPAELLQFRRSRRPLSP